MSIFLYFVFLFFIGSIFGYFLELFYRRIKHKKWVNPGFLVGPYLPIYGFGLCSLTFIYIKLSSLNFSGFIIIILMGISMTLIELIGGLFFLKFGGIRLWDYSDVKYNYKGVVCLRFSIIWTLLGAIYYYIIAPKILMALKWFDKNLSFSFILGIFFGLVIIDFIYSTNTLVKIRKFVKENNFILRYEEFKKYIKEIQDKNKEKYSFLFPFKQNKNLKDYLNSYKNNEKKSIKTFIFGFLDKK